MAARSRVCISVGLTLLAKTAVAQVPCLPQYSSTFAGVPAGIHDFASVQGSGDFNGDGREDVVVVRLRFNEDVTRAAEFLVSDGAGGFTDGTATVVDGPVPALFHARDLLVADFNGDGRDDVFIAGHGVDSRLAGEPNKLLLSQPNGRLADASVNLPTFNDFTHTASAGDVDRDGDVDVFVGNFLGSGEQPPYFLINDGTGRFTVDFARVPALERQGNWPTFGPTGASRLVDLNGDSWLDLVIGDHGNGQGRSRIYTSAAGTYSDSRMSMLPIAPPIGDGGSVVVNIQDIDIDQDGRRDIVLSTTGGGANYYLGRMLQVLMNRTPQGATVPVLVDDTAARLGAAALHELRQEWAPFLSVRDVNRDGLPDLVVRGFVTGGPPASPSAPYLLFNTPEGRFVVVGATFLNSADAGSVGPVVPLDIQGDGDTDFLSVSFRFELIAKAGCRPIGLEAAPTIAAIADQTTTVSTPLTIVATLLDADTESSRLTVTARSTNTVLLSNNRISITGSDYVRSLTMNPTSGASGATTLALVISDGVAATSAAFTLTVTPPGPVGLNAVVRGNVVTFAWTGAAIAGMTGYLLEAGLSAGSTVYSLPLPMSTTFTTSAPSGTYYVRVRAIVGGVPNLASNEIEVAIGDAAVPGTPSNLLGLVNGSIVHLAWHNSGSGGTRSDVLIEALTAAGAPIASLRLGDPTAERYSVAAPSDAYLLRVKAIGPTLQSSPSNAVLLTVPGACSPPAPPQRLVARVTGGVTTISWELGAVGSVAPSGFVLEGGRTAGTSDLGSVRLTARSFSAPIPSGRYYLRARAVNTCGQESENSATVTHVVP